MNGYRLLVPAIWLWFHADDAAWAAVEQALAGVGVRAPRVDGGAALEGQGFAIEYRADSQRLSVEMTHEVGPDAAVALAAVAGAAGEPDMETGNCWLWSPAPFAIRGAPAEAAQRLVRAARWVLSADRLKVVLGAVAAEADMLPLGVSLTVHRGGGVVRLEIRVPEPEVEACWPVFQRLMATLGDADHLAHVTVAA